MLILLSDLVQKYNIQFKGVLHVGAHECEEIHEYEKYLPRNNILWIEAMGDKVDFCKQRFPNVLIEKAVVSDVNETVKFNRSNNGQSSSILEFGIHKIHHPQVHYIDTYLVETKLLKDIICNYNIEYNFLNLDIQGVELKALKGMAEYLPKVDYIYTEVNDDYVYKDCALVSDIDTFLAQYGFIRVETSWAGNCHWGDAFYIRK